MQGYLPFDRSGDTVFKLQEVLATCFAIYILYAIYVPFRTSYNQDLDTVKSYYLIAFAAVVAIFFHSNLNRSLFADYGWAFTQYLETVAILSQFVLFTKKVLLFLFREDKLKPTLLTSLLPKPFPESFRSSSGSSLTPNSMSWTPTDLHQSCPNMLASGSWSVRWSICSSWQIICFIGLRPSGGVKVSHCLLMSDFDQNSKYILIPSYISIQNNLSNASYTGFFRTSRAFSVCSESLTRWLLSPVSELYQYVTSGM